MWVNHAELCIYLGIFIAGCISYDELHTYTLGLLGLLLNFRKNLICPTFALRNEPLR